MAPLRDVQVITQDGITHSLWGGKPCRFIGLKGVGIPAVRRLEERTPLQSGVVDVGFRLEPRQMQLALMIDSRTHAAADSDRDLLANIFAPHLLPLKLRVTRDDGEARQIDCHVNGEVDYPTDERMEGSQKVIVPLRANDAPEWYDPTQISTEASFSSGDAELHVAGSTLTWEEWPLLELVGPQTDPTIQWDYPTTITYIVGTVASGETWRLDLRPRYKSFKRVSDGANRLGTVFLNSIPNLASMSLKPLKWLKAYNSAYTQSNVYISATGTDANSRIRLLYYRRFISL